MVLEIADPTAPRPRPPEPLNPVLIIERLFARKAAVALASGGHVLWLKGKGHSTPQLAPLDGDCHPRSLLRVSSVLAIGKPGPRCAFTPEVLVGVLPREPWLPPAPKGYQWVETQVVVETLWERELLGLAQHYLGYQPPTLRPKALIPVLYLAPDDS